MATSWLGGPEEAALLKSAARGEMLRNLDMELVEVREWRRKIITREEVKEPRSQGTAWIVYEKGAFRVMVQRETRSWTLG